MHFTMILELQDILVIIWYSHTYVVASMCFNGLATFDEEEELVNYTGNLVKTHFPYLLSDLNDAGWNVSKCLLGAGEWRYSWKIEEYHAVLEDKASRGVREEELEEYH